jgi:hypothetical protein
MANNIVYISENYTNTSVAFKPSEFKFALFGPIPTLVPSGPANPCVIIFISSPVLPEYAGSIGAECYPLVLGGEGMTASQAQEALESVYTAVDAYYTSLVS